MSLLLALALALVLGSNAQPCNNLNVTDVAQLAREYAVRYPSKGDDFGERCEVQDETVAATPLNAIINKDRLWPDGVTYYQLSSEYSQSRAKHAAIFVAGSQQVTQIEAAIADLMESTKVNGELCIQILPRSNQTDYIEVGKNSGCSSIIGMLRAVGPQPLSLVDSCVTKHGTIMHEFLHAFGFYHEQSRPDRDGYVMINWDNIDTGKKANFIKFPAAMVDVLGTPYNYGSVMHYGPYGFTIDPSVPTIVTCDPEAMDVIGQRTHLSSYDIERVQILYGCIDPAQTTHFRNLDFDWSSIL